MRLLHSSSLELHEFYGESIPYYAILSHMWGDDEVTFQDLRNNEIKDAPKYEKIRRCCFQAQSDGWKWVWIDTCCIDKTSSAELSEGINSMYRWYQDSQVCYAYLVDIKYRKPVDRTELLRLFRCSRWFKRGWTLQELLAPQNVTFFNHDWEDIGTKWSFRHTIDEVARIKPEFMDDPNRASVAAKMSWLADRKTTRVEDIAYCALGLFGVNMPLLYGEGENAFLRLQYEIQKQTADESIFAWKDDTIYESGMFARDPRAFKESGNIIPFSSPSLSDTPWTITNRGFSIHNSYNLFSKEERERFRFSHHPYLSISLEDPGNFRLFPLNCGTKGGPQRWVYIYLFLKSQDNWVRVYINDIHLKRTGPTELSYSTNRRPMYIRDHHRRRDHPALPPLQQCHITLDRVSSHLSVAPQIQLLYRGRLKGDCTLQLIKTVNEEHRTSFPRDFTILTNIGDSPGNIIFLMQDTDGDGFMILLESILNKPGPILSVAPSSEKDLAIRPDNSYPIAKAADEYSDRVAAQLRSGKYVCVTLKQELRDGKVRCRVMVGVCEELPPIPWTMR